MNQIFGSPLTVKGWGKLPQLPPPIRALILIQNTITHPGLYKEPEGLSGLTNFAGSIHKAKPIAEVNEFRCYDVKIERSEKASSCWESNLGYLWLEPPVLCH